MGRGMVSTAESIVGKQEDVVVLGLSHEDSLAGLCERINVILREVSVPDGVMVLTDMLGGTPCNACLPLSTTYKVEIVSGMNLYMLLSALINRGALKLEDLANKIISDGKKNIANAKEIFLRKLA